MSGFLTYIGISTSTEGITMKVGTYNKPMILTLGKKFYDLGMFTQGDKKNCRFYVKKRMHGAPPLNFLSKGIYVVETVRTVKNILDHWRIEWIIL
jgi:hypothetical protein